MAQIPGLKKKKVKIETEILTLQVSRETKDKLWAIADDHEVGLSDVVRLAIEMFLEDVICQ